MGAFLVLDADHGPKRQREESVCLQCQLLPLEQVPSPKRPLVVVLGQEPLLPWLVLAGMDWDEVPQMLSKEHLDLRPIVVLVQSVPVGQQGSAELFVVKGAFRV